ncbi:hypothetical protein [Streptomyces sp. NPDC005890]|uniref:hypothetical protein n=1 Tax=Streptomyces sp. NPDC005890 TaxID=3154568 RepID=UPI0033F35F93
MGSLLAYWPEPGEEETVGEFAASALEGFPDRVELAGQVRRPTRVGQPEDADFGQRHAPNP